MNAELTDIFLSACLSAAADMEEGEERDTFLQEAAEIVEHDGMENFIREKFKSPPNKSEEKAMSAYSETSGGALLSPSSFAARRKVLTPPRIKTKSLSVKALPPEDKEKAKLIRREVKQHCDTIWDLYQSIPDDAESFDAGFREFSRGMNDLYNKISASWEYDTVADRKKAVRSFMRIAQGLGAKLSMMRVDEDAQADLRKTVECLRKMTIAANRMDEALSKLEQFQNSRR